MLDADYKKRQARQHNEAKYHCQSGWAITKFSDEQKIYILSLLPQIEQEKGQVFLALLQLECDDLNTNIATEDSPINSKGSIKKIPMSEVKKFRDELVAKAKALLEIFKNTTNDYKDALENLYMITYSQDLDIRGLIDNFNDVYNKIHLINFIDIDTKYDKHHDYYHVFIKSIAILYYNYTEQWPPKTSTDGSKNNTQSKFKVLCEYLAHDIVGVNIHDKKSDTVYKRIISDLKDNHSKLSDKN